MKSIVGLCLICLIVCAVVSPGFSATVVVTGVVKDTAGNLIPDAFVTVHNSTVQVDSDSVYTANVSIAKPTAVTISADGLGFLRRVFAPLNLTPTDGLVTKDLILLPTKEETPYNWDFETPGATDTGVDGWDVLQYINGSYSWSTLENHSVGGTASLNMHPNSPDTWSAVISNNNHLLEATSDCTYSFWYYVKGNGFGKNNFRVEWTDESKTAMLRRDQGPQIQPAGDWQRVTAVANSRPPSQTAYAKILLYQSDIKSDTYIDDIKMDRYFNIFNGNTIGSLKRVGDGAAVTLTGKVVTAVGGNLPDGVIYIEESPDRSSGIRVEGVTTNVVPGSLVTISGSTGTTEGGERMIIASSVSAIAGEPLGALGVAGKDLSDPMMVGLYVRVWGNVTPDTASSYFINDGSGPIKVIGTPPEGNFAVLNAVVSYDNGVQLIAVP